MQMLVNLDGIYATFEKLGYITGTSDKASEIITDLNAREERWKEGEAYTKKPLLPMPTPYDLILRKRERNIPG